MRPEPDDPAVVARMREAHTRARALLQAGPTLDSQETWGWRGRTLGKPVTTADCLGWLRVASIATDQLVNTFWNGAVEAQRCLPPSIPRPQLLRWHDWTDGAWSYRSELYEHISAQPAAAHTVITTPVSLPLGWWAAVRAALATIVRVNTTRVTIEPRFLAWAMPHYLGVSAGEHTRHPWTTAHGDFHFANLCAPELHILDWEGWGLAPAGYDAAMLHTYSLLSPDTAACITRELAPQLHSSTGRFAELTVITELLHAAAQGANPALAEPLRRRAEVILSQLTAM